MTKDSKTIYVTQPSLPPLSEFVPLLEKIWDTKVLTNGGPFHQALEKALCEYLGVEQVALFNNGTIALLSALQALRLSGEVITTPYSFVATTHSILWSGLTPVFVDVEPRTLNLDPSKIEAAITPRTSAIMPVHCYGHPCDVHAIEAIARKHGLKVLYDAAHAFGVRCDCGSVLKHGDLSTLSFHATKVFNTFEGGAIVCPDAATKQHIDKLKNFGFSGEITVDEPGLNGKIAEPNAAVGLLQLPYMDAAIAKRREVDAYYRAALAQVPGIHCLSSAGEIAPNYAYFPILVGPEYGLSRDALTQKLKSENILARRYFYPLISTFPMYRDLPSARPENLPVATDAAERVLCLPMYAELTRELQDRVIETIIG